MWSLILFSPFTALAEVEDALFGDSLGDVLLGSQAGRTHVAGVRHDQGAALTAGSAQCFTQPTLHRDPKRDKEKGKKAVQLLVAAIHDKD